MKAFLRGVCFGAICVVAVVHFCGIEGQAVSLFASGIVFMLSMNV